MKLREDQQRLKDLLKDTITLLCKNGLQYKDEFCVEALIGITLDQENVFLVNIKETIQLPSAKNGDDENSDTNESIEQVVSPKPSRKRAHAGNVQSSHVTPSKQQRLNPNVANPGSSTSSPQPVFNIKTEAITDGDDAELVFVKEEQNAFNSGQLGSSSTNVPYPVNFGSSILSMPGSQGPGDPTAGSGFQMSQNLVNTSLDSSSFMQQGSGVWGSGQKSTGNQQTDGMYECSLCCNLFKTKSSLSYHMRGIHGIGDPIECSCGQSFRSAMDLSRHRKKTMHISKKDLAKHT